MRQLLLPLALCAPLFFAPLPSPAQEDQVEVKPLPAAPAQKVEPKAEAKVGQAAEAGKADKEGEAAKTEKPGEKEAQKPAPANPLTNLIRNIFGGNNQKPANAGNLIPDPNAPGPANGDETARDLVDGRIPHDVRLAAMLRKAESLIEAGDYKPALEALEFLLDRSSNGDANLIRMRDGGITSVRQEANRILGRLPAEVLNQFRLQNSGYAQDVLRDAIARGDMSAIAHVATRYFHTSAGQDAANILGTKHCDRGEFGMAVRWYDMLLQAKAPQTNSPVWRLKAALAYRQAGQEERSRELLQSAGGELPDPLRNLAGTQNQAEAWLAGFSTEAPNREEILSEWGMIYGNPSHTGRFPAGDPLLLKHWPESLPLSYNSQVREKTQELIRELADSGRACIPAFQPLLVRGRLIFRTLRGMQVVDAHSGKLIWETDEAISAERILAGDAPPSGMTVRVAGGPARVVVNANGMLQEFNNHGSAAEQHPLAGLLFRNGTYGLLSSDGERVFVIEDHAILSRQQPGYHWGFQANQNDPHRRDWSSNRLTAYDLETGRPVWDVGGTAMLETFDPPLAGTYFYGAPTPDGDELYVVGERDKEIRLFALDAATGRQKWSQLIAYTDAAIDTDLGRRWFSAQVAVGPGVIVCPTTVGWLVAIDRLNHDVLWAQRYTRPSRDRNNHRGMNLIQADALNARWLQSAPLLVGRHIIYAPSEEPVLFCLDLFTGEIQWQKPKESGLYIAGVHEDRIIIVGLDNIQAIAAENGRNVWRTPLPRQHQPSGVGVLAGDQLHLPVRSPHGGHLWTFDLHDGKQVRQMTLEGGVESFGELGDYEDSLGNLILYDGMVISQTTLGVTAFEQRAQVEAQIAARRRSNPRHPWALLREAEIHILESQHAKALELLKQIDPQEVDEPLRPDYQRRMKKTLIRVIRADLPGRVAELDDLRDFIDVEALPDRVQYDMLAAESLEARNQLHDAWRTYWELAQLSRSLSDPLLTSPDETDAFVVDLDHWLSGKLRDLWRGAEDEERAAIDAQIRSLAETVGNEPLDIQERFLKQFAFHPAAAATRLRLALQYVAAGRTAAGRRNLETLVESSDVQLSAEARRELTMLLEASNDRESMQRHLQALRTEPRYAEVRFQDQPAPEWAEQFALKLEKQTLDLASLKAPWGEFDLKLESGGTNYSSYQLQPINVSSRSDLFYRQHRIEVDQQVGRLVITRLDDDSVYWNQPLRAKLNSQQGLPVTAQAHGPCLYLIHRDVVHCLAPAERKVLWTRQLDIRRDVNNYYRYVNHDQALQTMQPSLSYVSRANLVQQVAQQGLLTGVNGHYVCISGHREFTVLDALTGETLWSRKNVPSNTRVFGSEDIVYVVPPNTQQATAHRAFDGQPLDMPKLASWLTELIAFQGNNLVLFVPRAASGGLNLGASDSEVRAIDPLTEEIAWSHRWPSNSYVTQSEDGRLMVLEKSGKLHAIDLQLGVRTTVGEIPAKLLQRHAEIYTLTDDSREYLIVNGTGRRGAWYSLGLPSARVHGTIFAFDRATGELEWQETVPEHNLLVQQFAHSPVITFASRKYENRGRMSFMSLSLYAIDKQSGKKLLETKLPANSSFHAYDVNRADRYVELRSYNQRIRLLAVARDAEQAGDAEDPVEAVKPGDADQSQPAGKPADAANPTKG